MSIRKIARMGHPVLRKKNRELSPAEIRSLDTERLIQDMVDTMHEYQGIGLAAPQIHESLKIVVIEASEDMLSTKDRYPEYLASLDHPLGVYINPKITYLDKTEQGFWEGCLSVPELRGLVYRPRKIQVDFLDRNAKKQSLVAEGFLATVFQHELDHLDGILYVDRVRYEPGKSPISFTDEYERFLTPKEDDDIGEMVD